MKRLNGFASSLLLCVLLSAAGCSQISTNSAAPIPQTPTTTTLSATPNPASAGATVTLIATVASSSGTAQDTATFYDGTTALGTATLANNAATYTVNSFPASSTHSITAVYAGDAINAKSTSNAVSVTIGSVAAPGSITTHAGFTFTAPNQTITGFGAAEAFDLNYLDAHPYASEMYKALFDPAAGLGLTYLRVQNLYRGSSTSLDPDTPSIVAAANTAKGSPLTILMSSWSPPANLKSNGTTSGCTVVTNGNCTGGIGTLVQVSGAYDYPDFAQYWSDSLNAYAAKGVSPSYISIQNEPDFSATYTGCRFNPTEATYNGTNYAGYGLAFDAVYKKIQALATPPKMVGPETASVGQTFLDLGAQIPAGEVGAYVHHLYNVSSGTSPTSPGGSPDSGLPALSKAASTYPAATKFMTEYYDTPGFYNAWSIYNALAVGNDNAYIFWQAVWPSTLTTAKDQATDQAGLLYADNPSTPSSWVFPHGWTYNDAYYALKHFSYFIKPGYVRYTASLDNANERAAVFQSPDKKTTVIVVLNVSSATDGLSLDLSSIPYTRSAVYRSNFSAAITAGERFTSIGSYLVPSAGANGNNSGGIVLPPQGVVTIVLNN